MDHRFHHPPENDDTFHRSMNQSRGYNRFFSTSVPSTFVPASRVPCLPQKQHENRAYMYTKGRGKGSLKTRRIKGTSEPCARSGEDVRRRERGAGKEREGRMPGLHSAFRERDTFYRGAPSLRQFAAHTKRGSLVKLENSWFVLRWEKVYVKAGEEAPHFLFLFGKFFEFFFFFWFLGEKSCIISNYSD